MPSRPTPSSVLRLIAGTALFTLGCLTSACTEEVLKKNPEPQALCEAPKVVNERGDCVECVKNADCPTGQVCNLLSATCQPRQIPPTGDGGSQGCQIGARRCGASGDSVEECVAQDGGQGAFVTATACANGSRCNRETLTCAVCLPGETICAPEGSANYQRCKDDGTALEPLSCNTAGATGFACKTLVAHRDPVDGGGATPGLASCRLCDPGTSNCQTQADGGVGIQTCDSTGTAFTFTSCFPTNVCIADGGSGPYCQTPVCFPGEHRCVGEPNQGQERETCNRDGSAYTADNCTGNTVCGPTSSDRGGCLSPCEVVANSSSYFGCDYWGTLTSNNVIGQPFSADSTNGSDGQQPSEFAFVVGNTSTLTANVSVQTPGRAAISAQVAPNSTQVVKLPWRKLCGTGLAGFGYHLTSDVPVTVYQFNPLASALPAFRYTRGTKSSSDRSCTTDTDCRDSDCDSIFPIGCDFDSTSNKCVNRVCQTYSFSNDASLLLPSHLLGTSYVVVGQDHETVRQAGTDSPLPAFMSIVATQNDTRLQIRFAGATMSTAESRTNGCDATVGSVPAQAAGANQTFTLQQGQVLQFWTSAGNSTSTCLVNSNGAQSCKWNSDLTGSIITSTPGNDGTAKPIAVFSGADCTFKPFNKYACDHIEEEMFPFNTWGKKYVGVKAAAYAGVTSQAPDFWRIVSGCGTGSCPNGTVVTIEPAVGSLTRDPSSLCSTTAGKTTCRLPPLGAGQTAPWIEFRHGSSFVAQSDQPFQLAQYFVGQEEAGSRDEGDPSLILAPPVEQWRTSYTVLAPTTYAHNFLSLTVQGAASTGQVQVDGTTVPANLWSQVPGTEFYAAVFPLSNAQANHRIATTAGAKVGVVVYGYDAYVSYGYTGGLDLQKLTQINPGG